MTPYQSKAKKLPGSNYAEVRKEGLISVQFISISKKYFLIFSGRIYFKDR